MDLREHGTMRRGRADDGLAGQSDARPAHLAHGAVDGLPRDPGREIEQHPRGEAGLDRVDRGCAYAVVGGDARDVYRVHIRAPQPVGEPDAVLRLALESGVGSDVGTFGEDGFNGLGGQPGVEIRARGADYAVSWPRRHIIRFFGEMATRRDVVVLRRNHVVVISRGGLHVLADRPGDAGTAGHREAASLAEVVLDVDDDEGSRHRCAPWLGIQVWLWRSVRCKSWG